MSTVLPETVSHVTAERRSTRVVLVALLLLIAFRVISLGFYPLSDNTESRYAEIARRMASSGDWITPRIADSTVFWGKPPLSSWLSAASIQLLGANEWAVRLPSALLALVVTALVWRWCAARSPRWAALSATVLWGSGAFFVAAGAVMTDMALVTSVTLAMFGFWHAQSAATARSRRVHGFLFFVGLGLGMLAKGPVALLLIGLPVTAWAVLTRNLLRVIATMPWLAGSVVAAVVCLPWYAMAELRTPGFIEYFVIGEHWLRFTKPGWAGDLYGSAHLQPRGMIWVYLGAGMFPWTLLIGGLILRRWWTSQAKAPSGLLIGHEGLYLLLWALAPAVFFMLARNILWTYVLPGVPALAVLAGHVLAKERREKAADVLACTGTLVTGTLFAVVLFAQGTYGGINSTKGVVEAFRLSHQEHEDLLFVGPPMYSSSYYTGGKAQTFRDFDSLDKAMSARSITEGECLERVHLAVYKREWDRLSLRQQQSMHIKGRFGDYFLVTSDWHRKERHEEGNSNILNPIVTVPPTNRGY
jgi:4-amino-4-deoxy-L-arabinose transferase-like glycosyltransferase